MGRRKNGLYIFYIGLAVVIILFFLRRVEGFQDKEKPKGVIIELIGGLGNQLYIYSAGKVIEKALGVPILLTLDPGTVFTHSKTDYRNILFSDNRAINIGDDTYKDKIEFRIQNKFWDPWSPESIPSTDKYVYLPQQWYQHIPSIMSVVPEVSNSFIIKLQEKYPNVSIDSNSAFIHIRRGDYTDEGNNAFLLDMDYYNKAINIIDQVDKIKIYYIFSNDIEWCKQQKWNTSKKFQYIDEPDELKTLYMMSQCKGGAIISNSTFSTWGALLGPYRTSGKIIYPSKWLYGASTEFPEDWIRI